MERASGQRPAALHHPGDEVAQVHRVEVEHRRPGVVAADLQQVAQEVLEVVDLLLEQLRGAGQRRREVLAGLVEQLAGHADGGQGGAQLVADVGDEVLLQGPELLQAGDLGADGGRHPVEGAGQSGQVVLAAHGDALVEVAGGQALGHRGGLAHRLDHLAGHQRGHRAHQHHQGQGAEQQHPLDGVQGGLLAREVQDVVQLVGAHHGDLDLLADHQGRVVAAPGAGQADGLGVLRVVRAHRRAQLGRHHQGVDAAVAVDEVAEAGGARRVEQQDAGVVAGADRQAVHEVEGVRAQAADRGGRGGLELLLQVVGAARGVGGGLGAAPVEQALADLLAQDEADHGDGEQAEDDGGGDDPHLQRAAQQRGQPQPGGPRREQAGPRDAPARPRGAARPRAQGAGRHRQVRAGGPPGGGGGPGRGRTARGGGPAGGVGVPGAGRGR